MNYYKRHIGDYAKKTGRLSMLQHGAYTLLLDACYDRERFPTAIEAAEWVWASTPEEVAAVGFVLDRFFTLEGDVYVQKRIQDELSNYEEVVEKNRQIALDREAKKREARENAGLSSTKRAPVVQEREPDDHERPPNHKPLTTNHEPLKESKALVPSGDGTVDYSDDFEQFWKAYPKREGGNSKRGAFKAWKARLRSGVSAEDLILSAKRYADQISVQGRTGTGFVKQASTFLGPDEHWKDSLASNVRAISGSKTMVGRPVLGAGEFYHPDWIDKDPSTHKVCHTDTHDRTTGYAYTWLKKQSWYKP